MPLDEDYPADLRVRADRIDWIKGFGSHTIVSVNGKEIKTDDPVPEIIRRIRDPNAPYVHPTEEYKRPNLEKLQRELGAEAGSRKYQELMELYYY